MIQEKVKRDTVCEAMLRKAIVGKRLPISVKVASSLLAGFIDQLATHTMATGRSVVPGLGVFFVQQRKAHLVLHPQTKEPYDLQASFRLAFRPNKNWKRKGTLLFVRTKP